MFFCKIILLISCFLIFWAMIGYSLSLKIIINIFKSKNLKKNYDLQPTVTVMIVAHNEEKVIFEKLNNVINLNYPKDKIKYLVTSDNSTDNTNEIVRDFIEKNKEFNIKLYEVKQRKGKTNAQNEAQKLVDTDFLVMTDANSIMDKNSQIIKFIVQFIGHIQKLIVGPIYTI